MGDKVAAALHPGTVPTQLKFYEKTHKYTLDGKPVKGVTTLLGGGLPKPALPNWAAKSVAEYVADNGSEVVSLLGYNASTGDCDNNRYEVVNLLKGIPWATRDEAAKKGTEIHDLAERIVHGEEVEVPPLLQPYMDGCVDLINAFDIQPILTEKACASRKWQYAGKFDVIAKIGALGDETWLLDWKSSKGVYGETALQTAAYATAEFYTDGVSEIPMPKIDRIGVVHVTPAGSYLYDLGDIEAAFKIFTHVAYVAKQVDTIKTFIGRPIELPETGSAA